MTQVVYVGVPRQVTTVRKTKDVVSKGSAGPRGPVGATGATGATGDAGPGAGYINPDPTTITVGGIVAGSSFPVEQTVQQMFDTLLYPFQAPAFTSFGISGVSSPLEVGASFGSNVTFTWSTSQSANVAANSIGITDNASTVATGLANSGSYAATLSGPVTRTTAGSHGFGITGTNIHSGSFSDAYTVNWQWRRYYGASSNTSLTGTQILALDSNGLATGYAGSFAMAAGGYKYICLADAVGGQLNTVKDASTNLSVPMNSGSHTDGGGYGYELVSVTNVQGVTTNVRVYRTLNSLGSTITLAVT